MKKQAGFTLVELVVVLVILGIMSAVALPKFIDLKGDAEASTLQNLAGALTTGAAVNYAARKVNGEKGVQVVKCSDVKDTLQGQKLPTGYTIVDRENEAIGADEYKDCTLTDPSGKKTATFTAIGI